MDDLRVIETMLWDGECLIRLQRHRQRLAQTCKELGFPFAAAAFDAALSALAGGSQRVRVTVGMDGGFEVTATALATGPEIWRLAISDQLLDPDDPWLRVKTTNRLRYDHARANLPAIADEIVFLNTRGEVCEGAITNIFVDLGDGLLTPPVTCGLLPGVLRQELLQAGRCREMVLNRQDLSTARQLFVGNSLRGLVAARLV